jgi:hypothetical protein
VKKRLYIAIGVGKPQGMTPLPGVKSSLDAMGKWAKREGYKVLTITDEKAPVTVDRLAKRIRRHLEQGMERIVVYFIGHGFLNYPDQIWILSDGESVNTGRVSRDTFRNSLCTYRPKQIAIISDACLDSRHFATGTVPILRDEKGPKRRVFVEGIYATLPNLPAFQFHPKTGKPGFALFTSVLVSFLNGEDKRAFQLAHVTSPHVTSQTLYYSLPDAVTEQAAEHGVDQEARMEIGFPQGEDIYSEFDPLHRTALSPDRSDAPKGSTTSEPSPLNKSPTGSQPPPKRTLLPFLPHRVVDDIRRDAQIMGSKLVGLVHQAGESRARFVAINGRPAKYPWGPILARGDEDWLPVFEDDRPSPPGNRLRRELLTISWGGGEDRAFSMIPTFPNLLSIVEITGKGVSERPECTHLSWAPNYSLYNYEELSTQAWDALLDLTEGRLSSADAKPFADKLRLMKHVNPMIGIVCAYLYDSVGDVQSISRLCHFYVKHEQPIPFDIALLSGGEIQPSRESVGWVVRYPGAPKDEMRAADHVPEYLWLETPSSTGRVGGVTPLIRSGWSRLAAHSNRFLREFGQLEGSLSPGPVSTILGLEARRQVFLLLSRLRFLRAPGDSI